MDDGRKARGAGEAWYNRGRKLINGKTADIVFSRWGFGGEWNEDGAMLETLSDVFPRKAEYGNY